LEAGREGGREGRRERKLEQHFEWEVRAPVKVGQHIWILEFILQDLIHSVDYEFIFLNMNS
jgi:hypothetical protein